MPDTPTERRRRQRLSTMILCEIRLGMGPAHLVRIRDLSESGIKVATPLFLAVDERVWVRLPGASDWAIARVAWRAKGTAGLSFLRAVDVPEIAGARRGADLPSLRPNAALRVGTG
jgi:hypothetical protein